MKPLRGFSPLTFWLSILQALGALSTIVASSSSAAAAATASETKGTGGKEPSSFASRILTVLEANNVPTGVFGAIA
jgi:hypothetical protein